MTRAFDIRWLIGAGMALLAVALVWDAFGPAPARPPDDGFQSLDVALLHVRNEHEREARASDPGRVVAAPAPPAGCGARYTLPLDPADCPDPPEADADGELSAGVAGACGIHATPDGPAWAWDLDDGAFRGPLRCTAGSCRSPALDLRDGVVAPAGLTSAWVGCPP